MWHGEVNEFVRLLGCIGAHCRCRASQTCDAHQLLGDQRALDHLVFARGARQQFLEAEWTDGEPAPATVKRRRKAFGKPALVAAALGVLLVLMTAGGAWQTPTSTTPPIAAWQTR